MGRLLIIIAIVGVVFLLLRSLRRTPPPLSKTPTTEDMLRCKQCGVHIPSSEAVQANGENFCCAAHRDAYRA